MKVISLANIICDCETEMLILTMYLKILNTIGKYLKQILLILKCQIQLREFKKLFKYFKIQMYLTPCLMNIQFWNKKGIQKFDCCIVNYALKMHVTHVLTEGTLYCLLNYIIHILTGMYQLT